MSDCSITQLCFTVINYAGPSQTDPQEHQRDRDEPDALVRTHDERPSHRHDHHLVQAYQQKLTMHERRDEPVTSSDSSPKTRHKSPESTDASALPPRTKKRDKERKKKHRDAKTVSHQPDVDAGIYQITGGHFVDRDGGGSHVVDRNGGGGHFVDRDGGGGHFIDRDGGGGHFVDRGGGGGHVVERGGDTRQRKPRSESTTKLISSEEENEMKSVSRQQSSVLNTTSRSFKVRIDSRDGSRAQKSFVEPVSNMLSCCQLYWW